jgi:hypothetical protein
MLHVSLFHYEDHEWRQPTDAHTFGTYILF